MKNAKRVLLNRAFWGLGKMIKAMSFYAMFSVIVILGKNGVKIQV